MTSHFYVEYSYGFADSKFGKCCLAFLGRRLIALLFEADEEIAATDLARRFKTDNWLRDDRRAQECCRLIFDANELVETELIGTPFQQLVWQTLMKIPKGELSTYAQIAVAIGRPKAVRAVGTAVGANPLAFLVPCHRVIRTDGGMGGYRWGLDLKKRILSDEEDVSKEGERKSRE